jgi:hypothetical protein
MAETVYPPDFHRKVLALEAPGGAPAVVSVAAPTVVGLGEPFDLKVSVVDERGFPSLEFDGEIAVGGPSAAMPVARVPFHRGEPAVASVRGVTLRSARLHRYVAWLGDRTFFSNPVLCAEEPGERIYWGDPHVHTVLSSCHADRCRSLDFCYSAARYLCGLDWVSAADHVSNGRCDLGKWKEENAARDLHDDPPAFATLPAYEASLKGGAGGDNNVYMTRAPAMFADAYEDGDVKTLCAALAESLGEGEFFVVPHHTTRTGKHGEIPDEIYPGPELMPAVEIHSKWGTSEFRGNPNPLKKIHPGPSYAVDLLARGLVLGFVGGTDTHATIPSGLGVNPPEGNVPDASHIDRLPGLTAARARRLDRRSVFEAIKARRTYAASLERIYLDGRISGLGFGEIGGWKDAGAPRLVEATAAAQSDVAKVEVVRNGEVVHCHEGSAWHERISWTDSAGGEEAALESKHLGRFVYYYIRVTAASGAQAWSSPVWLAEKDRA